MVKKLTLCIVDDDETSQYILARTVKSNNAVKSILVFSDGEPAFKFLTDNIGDEDKLPDVIFLDINMPIMNGWKFLDEFAIIRSKLKKSITIYIVTSSSHSDDLEKAKHANAVSDYLIKPVKQEVIEEIIGRLSA
ncbi:MAG: response regulator [Cyclobacteriaceae bacterium]